MDGRPTWTDCDEAGDYAVPNLLSPRDLVSRPDNMGETVPHTVANGSYFFNVGLFPGTGAINTKVKLFEKRFNRCKTSP